MSNRKKLTTTKLPAPTLAQAIASFESAAKTNPEVVVPTHLNRRQLRSMRRKVAVIQVLQPVMQAAPHQHNESCSHYVKEN